MNRILDALEQCPEQDYSTLFEFILEAKHTSEIEKKVITFIRDCHRQNGQYPTRQYLGQEFGFDPPIMQEPLSPADLLHAWQRKEAARKRIVFAETLAEVSQGILTDEDPKQYEEILAQGMKELSTVGVPVELEHIRQTCISDLVAQDRGKNRDLYEFGVTEIDSLVEGIEPGTCTIVAGYPANFKTQTAISVAVKNMLKKRPSAILTLEGAREIIKMQALSNYSYSPQWDGEPLPFGNIQKGTLTDNAMETLRKLEAQFDALDTDIHTLGSESFTNGIISGLCPTMEFMADKGVQAFFIDHIQLLQYYSTEKVDWDIVNSLIKKTTDTAVRLKERGYNFRVILLSQINRESYKRACRSGGKYDLSCLSQHNELERSASYVVCNFATDELKALNEMRMQLIKNRYGMTTEEPIAVPVDPAYCIIGGISAMEQFTPGTDTISSLMGDDFGI